MQASTTLAFAVQADEQGQGRCRHSAGEPDFPTPGIKQAIEAIENNQTSTRRQPV
ncbi:MAG: hypothetical protein ACLRVN_01505 [Butyricicoccus sp.]